MLVCKKILIFCAFACCGTLFAQNIQNPVLPGVADAGVMKYNGKYYIGGVFTNGDFYVSDDLVHWGKPVHVVTMDNGWSKGSGAGNEQIHANDMFCLNGDFHLYWSVNYWGKDKHAVHIVHAQSKNVLGPYIESDKKTWMDNRIDPKVFKDDDGQLYMYMVRFTDGNTIWGRKMKNPAEFAGEPVCLFASLPDTWETMDNRVAEGPWVMKYRDRYYLMYNANHTSTEWGNYQLGVAEADSPLSFQNGNKYSYPVVNSNQILLEENYVDLLRYGITYEPLFDVTESYSGRIDWNFVPMSLTDYRQAFEIVKRNILAGNSYLANLTCKVPVSTNLTLEDVFRYSKALYRLWLKDKLVCFSPEIFVRIEDGEIKSFPMKGTIDATLPNAEKLLMDDPKETAEHATIVDLIRNDLSMVAEQVRVVRYRYCDRLETNKGPIFQTSSEICGVLPNDYPSHIGDIIFRLLPAGSITGAPKSKTMDIIEEAENYERGFYTGIMGYCDGRTLDSAVMIRFLEQEGENLYYKAGGGITSKSDLQSEYNEMIQKIYVPIY